MTQEEKIIEDARKMDIGEAVEGNPGRSIPVEQPGTKQEARTDAGIPTQGRSEIDELRAQLQRERVENGRVRKMNEENTSLREQLDAQKREMDELRAQLAQMKASDERTALAESVDENLRSGIDPDILSAGATMAINAQKGVNDNIDALKKRIEELENRETAQRRQNTSNRVLAAVDRAYPDFVDRVGDNGDLHDYWMRFLAQDDPQTGMPYGRRFNAAYTNGATEGVVSIIGDFYADMGRRSEMPATAPQGASTALSAQGPGDSQRRYSVRDFEAKLRDITNRYYSGSMSQADYEAARKELDQALDSERVGEQQ